MVQHEQSQTFIILYNMFAKSKRSILLYGIKTYRACNTELEPVEQSSSQGNPLNLVHVLFMVNHVSSGLVRLQLIHNFYTHDTMNNCQYGGKESTF